MKPKEIAGKFYEYIAKGDLHSLFDLLHDDIQWELFGPKIIPYFGRYQGKDGVGEFFNVLFKHEEILEFVPSSYIEDKEIVAVLGREKCRAKSTGKEFSAEWVQVFRINQGKISSWCEYIDTATLADAYQAENTVDQAKN
ncbi:nuclear transport factor 2 family protein [bacterium]|nr:nuclear transport factor 2 family protein [bacterium]